MKTLNQKTVNVKVTRLELCDMLLACTSIRIRLERDGHTADKWRRLHDELKTQLDEFDAKYDAENATA